MTRAFALLLMLAGCDRAPSATELARLRAEAARTADPAVTAALEDPIMSDRDLVVADDSRRVRSVRGPAEANYPSRTGDNAGFFKALRGLEPGPGCETGFRADAAFAGQLPPAFAMPRGATVVEAAGNDRPGCRARMAAFRLATPPAAVAASYAARASAAGYDNKPGVRGADHVVGGVRARDEARYFLLASPRAGGSEVSLLVTGG